MLTNFDLEDLSEHYGFGLNSVLMKDELKAISPRNGNYIVNLESSTQGDGKKSFVSREEIFLLRPIWNSPANRGYRFLPENPQKSPRIFDIRNPKY